MLAAKNITYKIGQKTLLDDVSVAFEPAKLNLIIGPNGAGKSTLIKVLCNQQVSGQGTVSYDGKEINKFSVAALAQRRAVLSQNIELAFPLTVEEVVMMGRYPHFSGQPEQKDFTACKEAMTFFDVAAMADRNYMTLSGGEKQRVHFARVVAQIWYPQKEGSRYLILDEPLTFLDVYYQFDFMYKVMELIKQQDVVVVGVVHDLNLAARFADKVVLVCNGKILADGSKKEVLIKENIKAAYHMEADISTHKGKMQLFF
jgi:iron complex transport system ATP-binding protein